MKKEAILHIPMSQYAYGITTTRIAIRLRTAKDDVRECTLYVGDTACRKTPIDFFAVPMQKVAFDTLFDYYEAEFESPYNRIYYYFDITDETGTIHYFQEQFRTDLPDDRSEYYKLPFNHRADIASVPEWARDAVIYNIFPDSFASDKDTISLKADKKLFKSDKMSAPIETTSKLGGTIKGITANVDYLKNLGINCIYINPLFAAGEYHKYDTLDYFSVDPCFGTNEDFKEMVKVLHQNGIRVLIDGVFNHVGWNFYAFLDVVEKGEKSEYVDWFYGLKFPVIKPDNPDDYPNYDCFAYERLMPKLNTENPEVREMILKVAAYWIKEFDIDGWRLDVASEVNDDFWREFRKTVKAAKKDAFIIGEVWESAGHWMQGDMYDSCMNYDLRKFCNYYFAGNTITTEEFNAGVTNMLMRYKKPLTGATLNLLDSHDVPRFLSVCNESMDKYLLAVVFQMMFVGTPSIFYGDEQGFTGVRECDYRRPMEFKQNGELFSFYKDMIAIRQKENAIRRGSFRVKIIDGGLYSFIREYEGEIVTVYLNNSADSKFIEDDGDEILAKNGYAGRKLSPFGYLITKGKR